MNNINRRTSLIFLILDINLINCIKYNLNK